MTHKSSNFPPAAGNQYLYWQNNMIFNDRLKKTPPVRAAKFFGTKNLTYYAQNQKTTLVLNIPFEVPLSCNHSSNIGLRTSQVLNIARASLCIECSLLSVLVCVIREFHLRPPLKNMTLIRGFLNLLWSLQNPTGTCLDWFWTYFLNHRIWDSLC